MHHVDFLPSSYRETSLRRLDLWWQIGVFVALAVLCAALSGYQVWQRRGVRTELAALTSRHAAAIMQENRGTLLREKLHAARQHAALVNYLQHPWPRSQILAAILKPLPESITLQDVRIARDAGGVRNLTAQLPSRARTLAASPQEELAKLSPVERDLKVFRDEYDGVRLLVTLGGVTSEGSDLHEYIAHLTQHPLVAKAEIITFDGNAPAATPAAGKRLSQFQVRVVIQPGYGQPGGPLPGRPRNHVAQR